MLYYVICPFLKSWGLYHNPRNGVPINQQGLVAKKLKLISPGIDSPIAGQWNFLDVTWANARGLAAWWVPFSATHGGRIIFNMCIYIYIYVCVCFYFILLSWSIDMKNVYDMYIYIYTIQLANWKCVSFIFSSCFVGSDLCRHWPPEVWCAVAAGRCGNDSGHGSGRGFCLPNLWLLFEDILHFFIAFAYHLISSFGYVWPKTSNFL